MRRPQPGLLALRIHKTRRHARPICSGLRQLALRRHIAPFGRTCELVTDMAPPETFGITRPLRKVASGPQAERVAGADLLQSALSETPPATVPGLQRRSEERR